MRLKDLIRDIVDPGGAVRTDSRIAETPISVAIASATAASSLASVRDFAVDTLGLGGALLPAAVSILVFAGCVLALTAKTAAPMQSGFAPAPTGEWTYSYGRWTRRFAQAALVVLLFVIPVNVKAAIEQTVPLPTLISGILLDAKTRQPVEGARIRIQLPDGVDVTEADAFATDSRGVLAVTTKTRVRRSARVVVYRDGCKAATLGLWKRFETAVPGNLEHVNPSISPFFTFFAECQE